MNINPNLSRFYEVAAAYHREQPLRDAALAKRLQEEEEKKLQQPDLGADEKLARRLDNETSTARSAQQLADEAVARRLQNEFTGGAAAPQLTGAALAGQLRDADIRENVWRLFGRVTPEEAARQEAMALSLSATEAAANVQQPAVFERAPDELQSALVRLQWEHDGTVSPENIIYLTESEREELARQAPEAMLPVNKVFGQCLLSYMTKATTLLTEPQAKESALQEYNYEAIELGEDADAINAIQRYALYLMVNQSKFSEAGGIKFFPLEKGIPSEATFTMIPQVNDFRETAAELMSLKRNVALLNFRKTSKNSNWSDVLTLRLTSGSDAIEKRIIELTTLAKSEDLPKGSISNEALVQIIFTQITNLQNEYIKKTLMNANIRGADKINWRKAYTLEDPAAAAQNTAIAATVTATAISAAAAATPNAAVAKPGSSGTGLFSSFASFLRKSRRPK